MINMWIGQPKRTRRPGHATALEVSPLILEQGNRRIEGSLLWIDGVAIADFSAYHSEALYAWPIHEAARQPMFEWLAGLKEARDE